VKEKPSRETRRCDLDLMVLSVLAEKSCYGYLIQQQVARASGGMVSLQAGTLYPLLHRLEADGLIRSQWDDSTGRRRKWYRLTAAGRRQLRRQAHEWQKYAECLEALLAPVLRRDPGVG
jgi:DNA-binding PadR family transcriptional regulator